MYSVSHQIPPSSEFSTYDAVRLNWKKKVCFSFHSNTPCIRLQTIWAYSVCIDLCSMVLFYLKNQACTTKFFSLQIQKIFWRKWNWQVWSVGLSLFSFVKLSRMLCLQKPTNSLPKQGGWHCIISIYQWY